MKTLLTALILITLIGCSDAQKASWNAQGKKHRITLYGSDGHPIKSWVSTGMIEDISGDGCYFEDVETSRLVTIRGTMIIDVID
jgi:hypothetical protein